MTLKRVKKCVKSLPTFGQKNGLCPLLFLTRNFKNRKTQKKVAICPLLVKKWPEKWPEKMVENISAGYIFISAGYIFSHF